MVVFVGVDGDVLLGECKRGPVDHRDLELLYGHGEAALDSLPPARRLHHALFTGAAVTDGRLQEKVDAGDVLLFTREDLYGRTAPAPECTE